MEDDKVTGSNGVSPDDERRAGDGAEERAGLRAGSMAGETGPRPAFFMGEEKSGFWERLVTAAVVLVLFQTLGEDVCVLGGASWALRRFLIVSGLAFDVFFTLEFLIRSWNALLERSFGRYMLRENGWVDFAASVPLLVFTSGPAFMAMLAGSAFASVGGMLGLLKVVKVVRMARVLRLLRLLKVVKRIRFADSAMVQRHSIRVITIAVSSLIFTATVAGMVLSLFSLRDSDVLAAEARRDAVEFLKEYPEEAAGPDAAEKWASSRPGVLLLKDDGWMLYARYDDAYLAKYFGPGDFVLHEAGPYAVWFDVRPLAVAQSRLNVVVFFAALAVVAALLVGYSPHFAVTVGDPVNVMLRGLREKSYNFEVSIPEAYAEDDMFLLAAAYNDEYLPLKERSSVDDDEDTLDISLDDIGDILDM